MKLEDMISIIYAPLLLGAVCACIFLTRSCERDESFYRRCEVRCRPNTVSFASRLDKRCTCDMSKINTTEDREVAP